MPKKNAGLNKMGRMLIGFLLLSCGAFAQKTITGKVINKTNQQPVTNATVQVKGTVIATRTDSSGDFSIKVPKENSVLEISSVGFASVEIPLAGKSSAGEISLAVSTSTLNEM